jgi:hypothetical protein
MSVLCIEPPVVATDLALSVIAPTSLDLAGKLVVPVTDDTNCPNAYSCSCHCGRCTTIVHATYQHCSNHGGGCHIGCTPPVPN